MNPLLIGPIFELGGKLIDKVFPDKVKQAAERAQAELALFQAHQSGDLEEMKASLSAILAEANSTDPWTSRARPSFLYVIYTMVLMAIPMGFLSAYDPIVAANVATGMQKWLSAIPEDLYTLFGVGYLGYTGVRSWEKRTGLTK